MTPHVELMAPAGDFASLTAALRSGADAVYFGVGNLNMRAGAAGNFTIEDLPKVVAYCKTAHAKTYLTVNTLIYDAEFESMKSLCDAAKAAGVDALIVSDPAVILYARCVGLPVHMSVQANVANIESVRFWAQYADVMVLARELSLAAITQIVTAIQTESICGPSGELVRIEIFAHGALCVAVSGKCYMSLALNGSHTSANRGRCQQPCRRRYHITDDESGDALVVDGQYVMSPKDICTIEFLDQILDAGVSVLKLEGRGRSPDYVATVCAVYREGIDAWQSHRFLEALQEMQWLPRLEHVFNRGFWKGGYYLGKPLGEWCDAGGSKAKEYKEHCGEITHYFPKLGVAEMLIRACDLCVNDSVWILGKTTGALRVVINELREGDDCRVVSSGHATQVVTFKVPQKVRPNDIVYVIRERKS